MMARRRFEVEITPADTLQPRRSSLGRRAYMRDPDLEWVKMGFDLPREYLEALDVQLAKSGVRITRADVVTAMLRQLVQYGEILTPWARIVVGEELLEPEPVGD